MLSKEASSADSVSAVPSHPVIFSWEQNLHRKGHPAKGTKKGRLRCFFIQLAQKDQRVLSSLLLGFPLGSACAGAQKVGVQEHVEVENAVVRRTLLPFLHVIQLFLGSLLNDPLEHGFIILVSVFGNGLQHTDQARQEEALDLLHAAVKIDGGEQGFESICNDALTLFSAPGNDLAVTEGHEISQADLGSQNGKSGLAHQCGAGFSQEAFVLTGKSGKQIFRCDHRKNGISEELQALVAFDLTAFIFVAVVMMFGIWEFDVAIDIFLVTYLFKVILAIVDTPFVYLLKKINPMNL